MPTREQDREFLRSGILNLEDYLLSNELFGALSAGLPRLTVGSLLLVRRRVDAYEPQPALGNALDSVRGKWLTAWQNKGRDEFRARLGLWRNYLQDYAEDPFRQADAFGHEVRNRAILQLLTGELPEATADPSALTLLDRNLEGIFTTGDFVWERQLVSVFPQPEFWFLYGSLKS